MKKWLRKAIISISAAVTCSVQAISSIPYYGEAASTQMYTWRMIETATVKNMTSYTSKIKNTKNYIYADDCRASEFVGNVFMCGYYNNTLTCMMAKENAISSKGEVELFRSTWYAPFGTTNFSMSILDPECEPKNSVEPKINYILVGDVNMDKRIDSKDSKVIADYLLNSAILENAWSSAQKIAADINNDGKIDLQDAILIEKFITGNIDKFPV